MSWVSSRSVSMGRFTIHTGSICGLCTPSSMHWCAIAEGGLPSGRTSSTPRNALSSFERIHNEADHGSREYLCRTSAIAVSAPLTCPAIRRRTSCMSFASRYGFRCDRRYRSRKAWYGVPSSAKRDIDFAWTDTRSATSFNRSSCRRRCTSTRSAGSRDLDKRYRRNRTYRSAPPTTKVQRVMASAYRDRPVITHGN